MVQEALTIAARIESHPEYCEHALDIFAAVCSHIDTKLLAEEIKRSKCEKGASRRGKAPKVENFIKKHLKAACKQGVYYKGRPIKFVDHVRGSWKLSDDHWVDFGIEWAGHRIPCNAKFTKGDKKSQKDNIGGMAIFGHLLGAPHKMADPLLKPFFLKKELEQLARNALPLLDGEFRDYFLVVWNEAEGTLRCAPVTQLRDGDLVANSENGFQTRNADFQLVEEFRNADEARQFIVEKVLDYLDKLNKTLPDAMRGLMQKYRLLPDAHRLLLDKIAEGLEGMSDDLTALTAVAKVVSEQATNTKQQQTIVNS